MEWRAAKQITADENITLTDGARRHIHHTEPKATLRPRVTELWQEALEEQRRAAAVRTDVCQPVAAAPLSSGRALHCGLGGKSKDQTSHRKSTLREGTSALRSTARRRFRVNLSDWIGAWSYSTSYTSSHVSQSVLKRINLHTQTLSRMFAFIYLFISNFVGVSYFLLKLLNNVRFGLNVFNKILAAVALCSDQTSFSFFHQ